MKMRVVWMGTLALALTACAAPVAPANEAASGYTAPTPEGTVSSPAPTPEVDLKFYGPAPELANTVWLNVDRPLRLADLRGQVVLIDMWTFG